MTAKIAGTQPMEIQVEAGESYFWCACGRSASQPFCDGAHKGSGMAPKRFKAQETGSVWLCTCKQTRTPPFCDGSHESL